MKAIALVFLCGFATNVWAFDEDDSYTNYESLVSELKTSAEGYQPVREEPAPVNLQGGLGIATSYVTVEMPRIGLNSSGLLKGFVAHIATSPLGKDLRFEAAFRNFAHDALSNQAAADLRELEASAVFLPVLSDKMVLRMGAGLSERFFDVRVRQPGQEVRESWATPYYSLLLGFERKVAKTVAVGPDFAHRAPLDASSYSKSSWDASFRLNATF